MKALAKSLLRNSPLPAALQEKLLFFAKCRYWPDFENPKSFNEKIHWRKLHSNNELFVTCCDKIAARDYVSGKVGPGHLVPLLFGGDTITADQLHQLGDDIVVKTNHDSGSALVIRQNTKKTATKTVARIAQKLKSDYGKQMREWWYSRVKPRVMVERLLREADGERPIEVQFYVFRDAAGGEPRTVVEVNRERGTRQHHRTLYDEFGQVIRRRGNGVRSGSELNHELSFPCPEHLPKLRELALALAGGLDHVRVDLYWVGGRAYFGELTLSTGGGRCRWTPREFDFELGGYWALDREPGGAERPSHNSEDIPEDPVPLQLTEA